MTRHSGSWGAPATFPIRAMRPADAPAVLAIYQDGLDSGEASFETTAPDWAAFDAAKLPEHRWVATDPASGEVIGWVAVSPVSDRCVYAGVVEHSVYVASVARGERGVAHTCRVPRRRSTRAAWTPLRSVARCRFGGAAQSSYRMMRHLRSER